MHSLTLEYVLYFQRLSSLERPVVPAKGPQGPQGLMGPVPEHKMAKPSSLPPHLTKGMIIKIIIIKDNNYFVCFPYFRLFL